MLGERTILVFSKKAHKEELARLKKLGYKITHPTETMATDLTQQLTGDELKEYLATRFPTQSKEMTNKPTVTAAFTPEWFSAQFADILCEASVGDVTRDQATIDNMMEGFELAINDWLSYHEDCCRTYREVHAKFLGIDRDW